MEDIAPELLKKIQDDFQKGFDNSKRISEIQKLIETGKATYADAHEFAIEVGELLSEAYQKNLSSSVLPDRKLYYNIAKRILEPTLKNDYEIVSETSVKVQEILNKEAGIGIKAIKPELNQDRIDGIIDIVSGKDQYDDIAYMLKEPIVNFSQNIVDATVRTNADFQWKAGMSPKIVRTVTGGCCEWCSKLAGTYEYSKVSNTGNDVFRRHKHCRCLVTYHPGDGKKQDVHSKEWSREEERDNIKSRKQIAPAQQKIKPKELERKIEEETGLAFQLSEHPKMFQAYTPAGLKKALENAGYEVKPLKNGNYAGVMFEDGGGYKVNFGGDGILMYHPEKRSHHGGAYYKTSTGKGGTHRYDTRGNEIKKRTES